MIVGHLGLEQATVCGNLSLDTTPVAKDPFMVTGTVVAHGLTTSADVVPGDTRLNGSLDLVGAKIEGSLLIKNSPGHVCQVDGYIFMIAAKINRHLRFRETACKGHICFNDASIGGDLWG